MSGQATRVWWKRLSSALWAAILTAIVPGSGLVYSGFLRLGWAVVGVEIMIVFAVIGATRVFAPTPTAVFALMAFAAAILLIRLPAAAIASIRVWRLPRRKQARWFLGSWVAFAAVSIIGETTQQINALGWASFSIPSSSGLPTFAVGDFWVTRRLSATDLLLRGDLIAFYARDGRTVYVKRVIGLPGDRVQLVNGGLIINDLPVRRDRAGPVWNTQDGAVTQDVYTETLPDGRAWQVILSKQMGPFENTPQFIVPPSSVFVLGDNRDNSVDSRMPTELGYVPYDRLIASGGTIYWSRAFERIGRRVGP